MRIIYLGEDSQHSTSFHRAKALERLGHDVAIYSPYKELTKELSSRFLSPFHYRTGYYFLQSKLEKWAEKIVAEENIPDLVWVNSGELFGPKVLARIKQWGKNVVLYNNDDPTGGRDGRRFGSLLKAIRFYDECLVLRDVNVSEYKERGAKKVLRVFMSYDEEVHRPFNSIDEIPEKFRSSVAFIGTWMKNENRDEFLLQLLKHGLPVSIWGNNWHKSPLWEELKPHYKGKGLGGRDYVAAIQGAKICIGMLSKGNRDLHTRRSVEVPYIGGLFCAERTSEHMQMYKEGEEAVYWNDADECARICHVLLKDDAMRERVRLAGMSRVRQLKVGNEDICQQGLAFALQQQ